MPFEGVPLMLNTLRLANPPFPRPKGGGLHEQGKTVCGKHDERVCILLGEITRPVCEKKEGDLGISRTLPRYTFMILGVDQTCGHDRGRP